MDKKEKHGRNAKYGWYRYDSRFALPVYDGSGEVERHNIFHASLLIRHASDGRMYLYDIIDIKKRNEQLLQFIKLTGQKTHFLCINSKSILKVRQVLLKINL